MINDASSGLVADKLDGWSGAYLEPWYPPYNPYLAHCAISELEFPIGNIYCIIPKERTPSHFSNQLLLFKFPVKWDGNRKHYFLFLFGNKLIQKFIQNSKISLVNS